MANENASDFSTEDIDLSKLENRLGQEFAVVNKDQRLYPMSVALLLIPDYGGERVPVKRKIF